MNAMDSLIKARAALLRDDVFFGALALKLTMKEDADCETAWTDGRAIGFNPTFALSLPFAELVGVFAHEVSHAALLHTTRRGSRDAATWNIACDYAINDSLLRSGHRLPSGALVCPREYAGKSPEEIYAKIYDGGAAKKDGSSGGGSSQTGKDAKPQKGNDPGRCGEVRDMKAEDGGELSESGKSEAESDWKVAVSQAAMMKRGEGGAETAVERAIREALRPALDWKSALHRFAQEQVARRETWTPPDRRFVYQGIYTPGLGGTDIDTIVIGVDTSGSIFCHPALVNQFAAEINAIRDETGAEIIVMYCDSRIRRVDRFEKDEPIEIHMTGGGGTKFEPVFEAVEREELRPACMIYLTDLDGSFPQNAPEYPVLWAVSGSLDRVPFGEVLRIR